MLSNYPQRTEETLTLGTIAPEDLIQQHVKPPQLRDGEYIANLSSNSPGSPSYVIGQRVSGKPYDRIIMIYGSPTRPWQRIWQLCADLGTQVDYRIVDDSSSIGFATIDQ